MASRTSGDLAGLGYSYLNETITVDVDVNVTTEASSDFVNWNPQILYQTYAPLAVAVDRFVTPVFYFIGIPCNPLCAFIWLGRHTRRNNSSAIYLGALSISHIFFLILHIFSDLNYAWSINTFIGPVSCEVFFTLFYWMQYIAPLLVLGFTVERYVAVCYPFAKERYCTVNRAVIVVVSLLGLCFLLSCVQAYMWTYDDNIATCNHRLHLQESRFPQLWTWITELAIFGVAPFAALIFNILVIREIRSITTRGPAMVMGGSAGGRGSVSGGGGQNQASTVMLLTVSFYLICTWLPATLVYSLERQFPNDVPSWQNGIFVMTPIWERHFTYYTIRKCVEEVALSNSACYFFIYCLTGKHFRDCFKTLVCPKRWLRTSMSNGSMAFTTAAYNGRNCSVPEHTQYIALSCKADNGHSMKDNKVTNV